MIITCPSCSARYPVDASTFAPSVRKVRCPRCGNTWHLAPPSDLGGANDDKPDQASAKLVGSPDKAVATKSLRGSPAGQKPLFNTAAPKAQPTALDETEDKPTAVAADDEGEKVADKGAIEEPKTGETPIKFYDASAAQSVTGGKLRNYLNDVASLRRSRVVGAVGWVALILFVAGSIYGVVQFRRDIAAYWPATAKLYEAAGAPINLVGFELTQVSYERQDEKGLPVIAVKGTVINVSGEIKSVPRVRVALLDDKQKELYHWTFALAEKKLKPQEKASFVTRLSSPPIGARDLEVRFVKLGEEPVVDGVLPKPTGEAAANQMNGTTTPVSEPVSQDSSAPAHPQ